MALFQADTLAKQNDPLIPLITKAIMSRFIILLHATKKREQVINYLTDWRKLAEDLLCCGREQDGAGLFPAIRRPRSQTYIWR
jgi:hypothetical protein